MAIVCLATGVTAARWYDSDKLQDKDAQLNRYRVALGIMPGSPNALVELTNAELRGKALIVSSRVREKCSLVEKGSAKIQALRDGKKIDEAGAFQQNMALLKEVSDEYHRDVRSDALNVQNELLRRLDPKSAAAVVRTPIFAVEATGTPIGIQSVMPSGLGMDAGFLCEFADELQQLAKLLPEDSKL